MKITKFDAHPNVFGIGLRVAPIDVGFGARTQGMATPIPAVASYGCIGERLVVEGTPKEIAAELRRAGYAVEVA